MRRIEHTKAFKRDYKRVKSTSRHKNIDKILPEILCLLAEDVALPLKYFDHFLSGDWKDHRDCYIKPDLILIYRKPSKEVLQLVRLGSHSELCL